jgi:hypothetical protein
MDVGRRSNAEIEKELGAVALFIPKKKKNMGIKKKQNAKKTGVGRAFFTSPKCFKCFVI